MKQRNWVRAALAVALVLCGSAGAQGQAIDPAQAQQMLASFIASPAYRAYVEQVLPVLESPPGKAACAVTKVVDPTRFTLVQPPTFVMTGAGANIDSGAWISRVAVERCGTQTFRRLLVQAVPGQNQLKPTALLPGEFRGDLRLEIDVSNTAFLALMIKSDCGDPTKVYVLDIKTVGTPSAEGWMESWTADACGKPVTLGVIYSVTPAGVTFQTEQVKPPPK